MDLSLFNTTSLYEAATDLFSQLNIQLNSNTTGSLPAREILKEHYRNTEIYDAIRNTFFIGIVDESIFREVGLFDERYSIKQALVQAERNYDGLMLFALELDKHPTRTEISDLTRSFNRISQKMPVGLLIKYENDDEAVLSIAISERFKYKQNWRQGEKAGKVIILRDIHTKTTHAGHFRILKDLTKPVAVTNYAQLHAHWLEVLDVSILNKQFFQELANWYFWAMDFVSFPDDVEKDEEVRNATNLIRLITRIIFIWFIKEKKLVPTNLFRKEYLTKIVVDFMKNDKSENYYHAILQNLFFGTLNQVIEERSFAKDGTFQENKSEYGVKNLFRYANKFLISEANIIELFTEIPFLNGGLFDCLDKPDDDGKIIYVDGFSRNTKKQSHIPDYVFFASENEVDLNEIYGTKNKRYKVQGLINLLESYKFTVAENTPIEEEIALDPELLGKVFENLLASYNPETKTTARKKTGSFYTPREIVNYMVDESLTEYLRTHCNNTSQVFDNNLRKVLSYEMDSNPFNPDETKSIIRLLNKCKILDPACGSGAFPMGILHKMVHLLNILDSNNKYWKELQKEKALEDTKVAYEIEDHEERKRRLEEIEDVFEKNTNDYGRKLYLIENCIYGIDIQPIAVQIAKLRFFISLIIDQNKSEDRENFGIRSLPNLETKFVAANTLISLERPQLKTGNIFLNDTFQEINKRSNQLKEIRHKYFNAKIRTEKLKFQKKDKELRKEISGLLVKVGHTSLNAHKIAAFDPYDQNHYAEWFEPEWMFGLIEGFDIVIGNPPWGATLTKDEKELLKTTYSEIDSSTPNSFAYFIGWANKNFKSALSFVLPDSILIKDYAKTRKLIKKGVYEIIWYENTGMPEEFRPFIYVDHDVCVINVFKRESSKLNYTLMKYDRTLNQVNELKYSQDKSVMILEEFDNIYNLIAQEKDYALLKKFKKYDILDEYMQCHEGIHTGNCREILFVKNRNGGNKKPLFYGGGAGDSINNFYSKTSGWYIDYRPELINKDKGFYASLRDERIFMYPKIYITRTGNPFKVFYDETTYASNNFFSLQHKDYDKNDENFLKYILPFLISKPAQYFVRTFAAPRLGSTFIETKIIHLLRLRIPFSNTSASEIRKIVDKIIKAKEQNSETDTDNLEKQLEKIIYSLYNFTEEEISVIENNGNNSFDV